MKFLYFQKFSALFVFMLVFQFAHGQEEGSGKIRLRAMVHDPMNPAPELYVRGTGDALQRLNLAIEGIGESQEVTIEGGSLRLFSTAQVDPTKPRQGVAAESKSPAGVKRVLALIVPALTKDAPPYRMMLMDESETSFPMGESRVINFTTSEIAIRAGEHRKGVRSGSVEIVPVVTRLNHMNQAPVQFYQKTAGEWLLVSERPTQFTEDVRHIFLVYTMPNVPEAQIRTLIDLRENKS